MNYTIQNLRKDFPNDDACLEYIFKMKYPNAKYYRVKGRKTYADSKGNQIYPLKGTIFEDSSTPLTLWFYAIYLFASAKNGVSAMELQRQLGTTYKCAWRIAKKIRSLMDEGGQMLSGIVEVDETYIGGKHNRAMKFSKKIPVIGMVERGGKVVAKAIPNRETHILLNKIKEHVEKGSSIMSDEYSVYKKLGWFGYHHAYTKHGKKHYVRGKVHTNTVEGLWSIIKNGIRGSYHSISPKHLQSYLDEFSFRYNYRTSDVPVFCLLLARMVK